MAGVGGSFFDAVNGTSDGVLVNDVHSRFNSTRVADIVHPRTADEVRRVVQQAAKRETAISICGGRHAMGGQQFGSGTLLVDLSRNTCIHDLHLDRGLVKAGAGLRWPELVAALHTRQSQQNHVWTIRQKQTGADELSLGGALSANVHGRGLSYPPIVADVESLTLVDAQGNTHVCSRHENNDLFKLCIGGYGAFGIITDLTLRLVRRTKLVRHVEVIRSAQLCAAFDERIASGYEYGDFQFSIDENSPDFLNRGVFSCYLPVEVERPIHSYQSRLDASDWQRLLYLAHTDRQRAFDAYSKYYLATDGQVYWSDAHQFATYVPGYHAEIDRRLDIGIPGSEMITELYVPRSKLAEFLDHAAETLRKKSATVIYGTVRLIERDRETFLAWAREPFACVIFNLHIDHSEVAVEGAAQIFRALIDLAIACSGSFYLTYHRWATRAQVEACYPRFTEWLALQRWHDRNGRWQSEWLRYCRQMFAS